MGRRAELTAAGERLGGRYRLDALVASGGMGMVWQATDELLDRTVALKQVRLDGLDPTATETARQRVLREARVAARLHHPNAVTIFDVIIDGADPWLVLEYVPSQSLGERMHEHGPLDPEYVARIGAGVADALAAAHERGIVHRDVKPANILLGAQGAAKLTDFGISRVVGDLSLTASGMLIGTPAYLAPEVASGLVATSASDVFALGATLYAAVEGAPPFGSGDDGNVLLLLRRAAEGQVPPPQRAGRLTEVLMRMLDPEPERRPPASEVAELLGRTGFPAAPPVADRTAPVLGAVPLPAPTVIGPLPEVRVRRRGWLLGGATVLTVAAIVAALLAAIEPGKRTDPQGPLASAPTDKCDKSRGELVIGMIGPLTGERAWLALGMRNATQLAVDQANRDCTVPGYRLAFRPVDDHDTESGAEAAAKTLVADPAVVGVVGPLYSETARSVQPVLAGAGVVHMAPASSGDSLTRGHDSVPRRPYPGFFRVVGADALEPRGAAEWVVQRHGRSIAIVDDATSYGRSESTLFEERAKALGGVIVVHESLTGTDTAALVPPATRVAAARPDAVFFAGSTPPGGQLSAQLGLAGLTVPVIGTAGLLEEGYPGRDGDVAVVAGAAIDLLPTATRFLADYDAAGFTDVPASYGAFSYDATTLLTIALGSVTSGGAWDGGRRTALIDAVQRTTVSGATGTVSFDEFGDNTHPLYTIRRAAAGTFTPMAVQTAVP